MDETVTEERDRTWERKIERREGGWEKRESWTRKKNVKKNTSQKSWQKELKTKKWSSKLRCIEYTTRESFISRWTLAGRGWEIFSGRCSV